MLVVGAAASVHEAASTERSELLPHDCCQSLCEMCFSCCHRMPILSNACHDCKGQHNLRELILTSASASTVGGASFGSLCYQRWGIARVDTRIDSMRR